MPQELSDVEAQLRYSYLQPLCKQGSALLAFATVTVFVIVAQINRHFRHLRSQNLLLRRNGC
jgi:hypothetical protein